VATAARQAHPAGPIRRGIRARPADVIDIFVYVVVLELVDLVFGDSVSLGGFIPVTLLVAALLASRAGVRRLLDDPPSAQRTSAANTERYA
jgi:hypothetical protein